MPPLQIVDSKNRVSGLAVEIVRALLAQTGNKTRIMATNSARVYKLALEQENVLIFSISRTEHRET